MGGALKQSSKIQRRAEAPVTRGGSIRGASAIAALASPVRQEIVDTVEALGGVATIAELAARLGRPADGLYYHVRRLAAAGLLVREDGTTAERFRTPAPGRGLALDYRPDDPRNAAAIRRVIGGMLRIARRDFDAGLAIPGVVAHGPRRALWAGRGKGWVTPEELGELNALAARATAILRHPRAPGRDRLVSFCFVLAPIAPRAARRGRATRARGSSGGGGPRRTS